MICCFFLQIAALYGHSQEFLGVTGANVVIVHHELYCWVSNL